MWLTVQLSATLPAEGMKYIWQVGGKQNPEEKALK